jgi:uncharacterized membrane protein
VPEAQMTTARMEAFSDGVIAIIVTIMVLELKAPSDRHPSVLYALWPTFLSYALSYLTVAEYWVNHHHLLHQARHAESRVLWSNILFLFFLSLVPFATAYLGQCRGGPFAVAVYSASLLLCGLSYKVLGTAVARQARDDAAMGVRQRAAKRKGTIAGAVYAAAVVFAFRYPALALLLDLFVAIIYFIPGTWVEPRSRDGIREESTV